MVHRDETEPDGASGVGRGCLERGERQRLEPFEDRTCEVAGQPFRVGLDLG